MCIVWCNLCLTLCDAQTSCHHKQAAHLVLQTAIRTNHVIKDMFTHVSINCTKWVIQEVDVSVLIDRSGQRHALLLTTRQVDALVEACRS